MQDEGEPFGGRQRVQHNQKREADRLAQQCLKRGVPVVRLRLDRLQQRLRKGFLASRQERRPGSARESLDRP